MTFTAPTISGYNSSPPSDDGTVSEANRIKWATIKSKLADPIKNFVDSLSAATSTAFTGLFLSDVSDQAVSFSVGTADDGKFFNCTGALTVTLPPAASAAEGFKLVVFNNSTGIITVDGDGSEQINAAATHTVPNRYDAAIYECTGTGWFAIYINGSDRRDSEVTIASASTTDLGSSTSNQVLVSGTTTITAFGSGASVNYPLYYVRFSGALTITYNATSLITPSGVNIVTRAGDSMVALYLGSGNWRILSYFGLATTAEAQAGTNANTVMTPEKTFSAITQRITEGQITLKTLNTTTGGTSVDFTGIPSTAKRITLLLNGVSTNGTDDIIVQLNLEITGYSGYAWKSGVSGTNFSSGFKLSVAVSAASVHHGRAVLNLANQGTNLWNFEGGTALAGATDSVTSGFGSKALSAALTQVRLTTSGGANTFNAMSCVLAYEL